MELDELEKFGLSFELLSQYQIAFLPENIFTASEKSELQDTNDSIFLSKFFKQEGIRSANSYDLKLNSKTIERRSIDF